MLFPSIELGVQESWARDMYHMPLYHHLSSLTPILLVKLG